MLLVGLLSLSFLFLFFFSFLGCGAVVVVIHTCAFPMRCMSLRSSTVPFFSGGKSVRVRVSSTATMYEASSSLPMAKGFRCAMVGLGFVCSEGWWKTKKKMMMTGDEGEDMRESEDFHNFGWHSLFKIFFFFLIHFACPGFRVRSFSVVYSYCCCVRVDSSRLANIHTHTLSLSLILHLHLHHLVWNGTLPLHIRIVLPYIAW